MRELAIPATTLYTHPTQSHSNPITKMVATYKLAGREVGSHWVRPPQRAGFTPLLPAAVLINGMAELDRCADHVFCQLAIATLGTFFVGSWAATRGPAKPKQQAPPTNANNDEEEKFIQYVKYEKSHFCITTLILGCREFIKEAEKEGNGGAKQREGGGH